jgi:hypothetical protein
MPQKGRPKKNGRKEPKHLFRLTIALVAYEQARLSGEKYSVALQAAVDAVRRNFPEVSMSETEVKRILAEFRSKGLETTLFFEKTDNTISVDGKKYKEAWVLRFGRTPVYPRHNARAPQQISERNEE